MRINRQPGLSAAGREYSSALDANGVHTGLKHAGTWDDSGQDRMLPGRQRSEQAVRCFQSAVQADLDGLPADGGKATEAGLPRGAFSACLRLAGKPGGCPGQGTAMQEHTRSYTAHTKAPPHAMSRLKRILLLRYRLKDRLSAGRNPGRKRHTDRRGGPERRKTNDH